MKDRAIQGLYLVFCIAMTSQMFGQVSATDYTAPIEHSMVLSASDYNGYHIDVSNSKTVSWKLTVQSGSRLDLIFIDESEYDQVKLGRSFYYYVYYSDLNTMTTSKSLSANGNYVLLVIVNETYTSPSSYNIKISVTGGAGDSGLAIGIIAIVIIVVVIVIVALVVKKRRDDVSLLYYQMGLQGSFSQPGFQPTFTQSGTQTSYPQQGVQGFYPQPAIQSAGCQKCGLPLRLIPQYQAWYCPNCRTYSKPAGPSLKPPY